MRGEDDDQRPVRLGPLGRHAVARQIPRHQVQQPGHRRRAGEPQDRDGADVVDRAEGLAEVLVREVGERAAVRRRRPPRTASAGISSVVTKLLATSSTLMISAAAVQQLLGVPDAARRMLPRCQSGRP